MDRIGNMFSVSKITLLTSSLDELTELRRLIKRFRGSSYTKTSKTSNATTHRTTVIFKDRFPEYFAAKDYEGFVKSIQSLNLERTDNHVV